MNVLLNGTSSYQDDRLVSHQYFDALGVQPQWGRGFSADEDGAVPAPVVVLNERFVRDQGLEPAAMVGRDIELGGRAHTIVGVLSAAHTRPSDADIYRPLGRDARGSGQNLSCVCRLAEGVVAGRTQRASSPGLLDEARRRTAGRQHANAWPYSAITLHEWEFGVAPPAAEHAACLPSLWCCWSPPPTRPGCCWFARRDAGARSPCGPRSAPRRRASRGR